MENYQKLEKIGEGEFNVAADSLLPLAQHR